MLERVPSARQLENVTNFPTPTSVPSNVCASREYPPLVQDIHYFAPWHMKLDMSTD